MSKDEEVWFEIYILGAYPDPHAKFAFKLGVSRAEAKRRAYQIAYTVNTSKIMEGYRP